MFRERRFRFNVWVLGATATVAILLVSKLLTLTGRWRSEIWSDPLVAVLTLAAVWLMTGLLWAVPRRRVGGDRRGLVDLRVPLGPARQAWKGPHRAQVPRNRQGFRKAVAQYAPEGNPLRMALDSPVPPLDEAS